MKKKKEVNEALLDLFSGLSGQELKHVVVIAIFCANNENQLNTYTHDYLNFYPYSIYPKLLRHIDCNPRTLKNILAKLVNKGFAKRYDWGMYMINPYHFYFGPESRMAEVCRKYDQIKSVTKGRKKKDDKSRPNSSETEVLGTTE